MNPAELYKTLTLRSAPIPGFSGPLPNTLVQGALGAGAGYLGGSLFLNREDPNWKRRRDMWMAAGGLGGMALRIPDLMASYQEGEAGDYAHHGINSGMEALMNPVAYGDMLPKQSSFTAASIPGYPRRSITAGDSIQTVLSDPTLDPVARAQGVVLINEAARGEPRAIITTGDLVRGAVGLGLGYSGGLMTGKVLGGFFSLPGRTQKRLAQAGALGGLLRATGVWN